MQQTQQTQQSNKGVVEIDLLEVLQNILNHSVIVILITMICGIGAFSISRFCITPQYESMASLYMLTKETTLTSLADLQIGAQLTNDYQVIVKSRPVLQDVVDTLGLEYDYKTLRDRLKIENPTNTRILTITIQDSDPEMAKLLVDTVAATAAEYIGDTMELEPPKIIETGEVATQKASPSNGKNALIGAFVGCLLICLYYAVQTVLNDTIVTPEDVDKYLGLSVLASIPLRADAAREINDKASINRKKNKKKRLFLK